MSWERSSCATPRVFARPKCMSEHTFDAWENPPYGRILHQVDKPVVISSSQAFPWIGVRRMTGVPLWVRNYGFRPDYPEHAGELKAWLRCFDNSWVGCVEVVAACSNGLSSMPMRLWVPGDAIQPAPEGKRR